MTGKALFRKVFENEIEAYGSYSLSEIEENDLVTYYEENDDHDEWWVEHYVVFRYKGKKYGFYYRSHVMTADSEWDEDSFHVVEESDDMATKMINKIIKDIEEEYIDSTKELIERLEEVKKLIGKE